MGSAGLICIDFKLHSIDAEAPEAQIAKDQDINFARYSSAWWITLPIDKQNPMGQKDLKRLGQQCQGLLTLSKVMTNFLK